MVLRYGSIQPFPADVFLHRADVEKIISMTRQKRKGGPGRNTKYPYDEAIISLIGDEALLTLDLTDRVSALRAIKNRLSKWFEANADASGDVPRPDQLTAYAEKIYDHLKNLVSSMGS